MKENYPEILDYINTLTIIDTHEHLPCKEENRARDIDVIQEYLGHYFDRDLFSSGLPKEDYYRVIEQSMPVME